MSRYRLGLILPFVTLHLAAVAVCFTAPFTPASLMWLTGSYFLRMFGVTAGYHRYFSHHSYKMGRWMQLGMAVLAQTSGQKSVLWWAANHRAHHRLSDTDQDVHSPLTQGFWWAHCGWVISNQHDEFNAASLPEFARFRELRWLHEYHWVPTVVYAAMLLRLGGPQAFLWGYVVSTTLLYHFTFSVNSIAHLWGSRRFDTPDGSRNNFWVALLTLGEGWHNNHHFSAGSCRQGYRWWEIDVTYWVLRGLSAVGLAWNLRPFRSVYERAAK